MATQATGGGSTVSFGNTPQANTDIFSFAEDASNILILNVLANDLGGAAKTLFSLDDGMSSSASTKNYAPADLLVKDVAYSSDAAGMAATGDRSALGARIWIEADGTVHYDKGDINVQLQALATGQTLTDTFTYAIQLGNGTLSWATVTLQFNGANDSVFITSSPQSGSVVEDANATPDVSDSQSAAGTISFNDADLNDTHSASFAAASSNTTSLGTFSLDPVNEAPNAANGSVQWHYALNNSAAQYLAAGQSFTESFVVTVNDGHGSTATQTVTVTITGTNDNAVITVGAGNSASGAVTEDAHPTSETASGTLSFSDVDLSDTHSVTSVTPSAGALGMLTASVTTDDSHTTGTGGVITWNYSVADSAIQYLAQGQTKTETFTVHLFDGTSTVDKIVTVTITGTNDAPVITSSAQAGSVQEDTTLTATGQVTSSDVDHGATAAYSGGATGTYGSFAVNAATGVWTYTLDNATHQDLAAGESHTETFTVTVTDDKGATATQDVVITITGTNDAPVITSSAQAGSVQEDTTLTATGQVTSSDVDHGATAAYSGGATGTYGSFAVNAATGVWTYTLDNATHQDLAAGESHTETFTVTVTDDKGATATQDVVITITGTNDAPTVTAGAQSVQLVESGVGTAGTASASITQTKADPDTGDSAVYDNTAMTTTGGWATGDGGVTYSKTGIYGTATLTSATGLVSYALNNADPDTNALAGGASVSDNFTVYVKDGSTGTASTAVNFAITGTNDAPVGVAGHTLNYTENHAATAIDPALTVSDVDNANLVSATVQITGNYVNGQDVLGFTNQNGITGSFNAATGMLTLTGSSSVANYQTALDSVTYFNTSDNPSGLARTVTIITNDGAANSVAVTDTINVTPVNDAPVGVNDTGSATEAGGTNNGTAGSNAAGNVLANDTDVDNTNASLVVSAVRTGAVEGSGSVGTLGSGLVGAHGTLTLNANGSYTYLVNDSDSAVQALNSGQTITDSFNYTVKDPGNLTDTAVLTVTINGANDAPVNTVPGTQEVVQNTNVTFNGAKLISISDVDVGAGTETVTLSVAHGTLTLSGTTGLSFTTGDGTTDTTMTFSGTVTNINNALNGLLYNPTDTFVGADTLTITTTDQGGLSDSDIVTINEESPNPGTLTTSSTDVIFYASGTNTLNGTNSTLNGTDNITGGTGTDTLIVTGGAPGPFTFGNGVGNLFLTNFEVFKLVDTNSGNHTDNVTFLSTFQNNGTLTVDATGISGNGKLNLDASAVTSGGFIVIGGDSDDILKAGSGDDTLTGGLGNDTLTGGAGADMMTGGGGIDTFIVNSTQSLGTVGGSGDVSTISGYDIITDFVTTGANDILNLPVTNVTANTAGTDGADSTLTISGQTVKSHAITSGIITFDDANAFGSALTLTSTANVAAVVQYLHNNDIATGTGAAVAFVANIGGTAHSYVFEQVGTGQNAANDILVDLVGVTLTNITQAHLAPAGIAGEAINLGLTNPADHVGAVSVSITGVPSGWTLSEGTDNGDGTWTVQTNDVSTLSITASVGYAGAVSLHMSQTWSDGSGGTGLAMVTNNVEAYAPGSPIFALSGDDNLTGSSGHDMFVFSQPIGHDVIYSFDAASDQIDLIGYANFTGFGDIQAHMANDAAGNAVITLADGQSITLNGVDASSLTASDFVFDQTPVTENAGHMVISDGAILPLSGVIDNTGTMELNSTGDETDLQLIEHGITLQGGGHVDLSDSSENVITGTVSDVTLTNVDNTISGAGHLGDGVMGLVNEGTIIATGTNALDIDTGANAVTNPGTLEATGTGGLEVHSDLINTGVLWANGGNVTIDGNVSGNGTAQISGSATLEFGAASSANVALDAQATGTIVLHDSFDFSGVVSGFNGDDHLDLLDVAFGAGTTASYVANQAGAGGTLSVTDGVHTANITLLGQYDPAGFQTEADKNTGTLISYHDHLA
ncbi:MULTISPECIES: VCBS domain-containing protein [unclassified Bradyrhizobium]|uniref:VCBS domain-containing protein n=1 Tax=unclassified Bradyrhizobium TaxID=2631580 RepID=UPI001FF72C50|nr:MULTISPECIES: VCBS domain-containing protein [unclassified Bradyrhizobium]MCK1372850.1 VCBS domain-containing protein [Bradyrhizobium sp. 49]MCK1418217.1 VCBS domain-containing protein [Bradyrhizobium sp. CW4]MCK1428586.1 VCBS domain-containing protein [Bradyrhizobium sp. 87]